MKNRLVLFFGVFLGSLLFLAILFVGLAQTDFFQEFLLQKAITEAKQQGISLEAQGMKSSSPLKWSLDRLSLTLEEGIDIQAENVRFKIAPLSLLKKQIILRSLSADHIYVKFTPEDPLSSKSFNLKDFSLTLPFDLYAKNIECEHISFENLQTHETLLISCKGRAKIDRKGKELSLDFLFKELLTSNSLEVVAVASKQSRHLEATLEISFKNTHKISNFFKTKEPIPSLKGICKVHGGYGQPLVFEIDTHIESFNLPHTSCLLQGLDFKAAGTLFLKTDSPLFLSVQKLHIKDSNLGIDGSLDLSSKFFPISADLTFFLKDTRDFSCFLPFHGELDGKVQLTENSFLSSFHSTSLTILKETYEPVHFELSAKKEENQWIGSSSSSFEHKELPLKGSFHFVLEEGKVKLLDLSLIHAESKIGGNAEYSFKDFSYKGSFFVMAEELRPLRLLFPDSEIDGKLGGSFSVEGNNEDLKLELSCLLKSVRYQNSLIDTMQLEANIENLLSSPLGHFSCDAKNIFFRDMLLSHVSLVSEPAPDALQTFSFLLEGDWKQKLNFHTTGLWKKEGPLWKLHIDLAQGTFLSESFALKNPFSIERSEEQFAIEPCFWTIGEGDLATEFCLGKDHILYKGEGNHLPLGILGVLYPKMAFQGSASFQSALSGPSSDLKGHFYLSLERADFSQNKAKGSLQIHLSSLGTQIHSHLYATNNQFLDWTATLPLTYTLSPFSWNIDNARPITSELTMQGAVEEIFDFVNTASHKASGWITAHLFLSGNLKEPALLGSLKCEQGSYENYFTGTKLKTIEAELRASSHTLELTSLTAADEKEGTLTALGSLFLSPKEKFPFDVKADLNKMHVVRSDLIDASLSGFLHIVGDQGSSLASGSLVVDHALFKIFDNLPYEVPTLPVTYINKPIHLQTNFLEASNPYPFYLDVQLTAENTVFVEGRGLDSNWLGDVKLTGTIANPSAIGSLTLKEGVFVFSGKTFTLMQGEISFHDKPTPGAYLKIHGELALPSTTVLAQMQGPLTSAQLTFQSIPSLPTSSILSLILFNKDISEISPLQALQLAQTIVSLSGNGGPGVLESIRKKIGVDRLTIVGKGETDEISVQIGWYLSHGITLSLSQSATSSDVTVEVDLKKGFIFQAETQNQEEGKFSFKWNKNY